ncbi:MAG: hypothetical protein ABI821_15050 [Pseudomonadota bacterium]
MKIDLRTNALVEGDFVLRDFHFSKGETLPELRIHYRTFGRPVKDKCGVLRNAVIIDGTGGSGAQFIRPEFAAELFGAGQLLDATRYFIVLPDASATANPRNPATASTRNFRSTVPPTRESAVRLLAEGLGVKHLRLVMGTSSGAMQTWVWGNDIRIGVARRTRDGLRRLSSPGRRCVLSASGSPCRAKGERGGKEGLLTRVGEQAPQHSVIELLPLPVRRRDELLGCVADRQ